jgi:(p)ppGpp synthase/HD superfamily hydrolase
MGIPLEPPLSAPTRAVRPSLRVEQTEGMPLLTDRYDHALTFARTRHAGQVRKATQIPYVAHLIAVSALVLEDGGDEDQAVAGLLHDVVEDCGGAPVLAEVRAEFGDEVARIVDACSDTDEEPKPPWEPRKRAYIAHLEHVDEPVLRVSCADKLHNARAILGDLRVNGHEVWSRFKATPEQTRWYYRTLAEVFTRRLPGAMPAELRRTVEDIDAEAARRASAA